MKGTAAAEQALRLAADRARRGGSGALSLAIRSSEAESPLEGHGRGSAPSCAASMAWGPRATSAREPGQVRKEAALSGLRWAQRGISCRSRYAMRASAGPTSTEGARSTFFALAARRHAPRRVDARGREGGRRGRDAL